MLPDFEFNPRKNFPGLCITKGCIKRALPDKKKCIDCEVEDILPAIYDDVDEICRLEK